jgi:hypothetical protein
MTKTYSLSLGCPSSLCTHRSASCETTFYVERCFYNTNKYKAEKPKQIAKKWKPVAIKWF